MFEEFAKYDYIFKNPRPKKTFATPEEWHEWVNSMYGSITDETFVEPEDAYFDYDEVPALDLED